MNILFIHQNFPGQFRHLAPALVDRGHRVVALHVRAGDATTWKGVEMRPYRTRAMAGAKTHPWVSDVQAKVIRAEACYRAAQGLQREGFSPDLIVAHPGWGESLFVKEVWPDARLAIYAEFHYTSHGADSDFDPEFSAREDDGCRMRMKSVNNLLHFEQAEAGISPTPWQASTFPKRFRDRISVIHDGIDTDLLKPDPHVSRRLGGARKLTRDDEVITFVNRNLEPYRGYHVFMRALPELLRRRPDAQVLIVGGDGTSYGAEPPGGTSWMRVFVDEVRDRIPDADWARVGFLGRIEHRHFRALLQLSRVHVYLTYPFVLSWSLLEAMSTECAIVASDTGPVRDVISDGETGRLVDFFDTAALVDRVCDLLDDPRERARLGANARSLMRRHYDLATVCLPRQIDWVEGLLAR